MTSTTTPSSIEATVANYFAMWNTTDPAARRALIERTWTPDARYCDTMFAAEGVAGLEQLVAGLHAQYPEHQFQLVGGVETHHDRARWQWTFNGPRGGAPVASGVDFAILAEDGRLRDVTGFFQVPA